MGVRQFGMHSGRPSILIVIRKRKFRCTYLPSADLPARGHLVPQIYLILLLDVQEDVRFACHARSCHPGIIAEHTVHYAILGKRLTAQIFHFPIRNK